MGLIGGVTRPQINPCTQWNPGPKLPNNIACGQHNQNVHFNGIENFSKFRSVKGQRYALNTSDPLDFLYMVDQENLMISLGHSSAK